MEKKEYHLSEDLEKFLLEVDVFNKSLSNLYLPELFGITDGKAIGTFVEHRLKAWMKERLYLESGNSAEGIDWPSLELDLKVTSVRQPQSSCPFRSARQKVYGLGYHLLVLVYSKTDDSQNKSSHLSILHAFLIAKERTGDYQTTIGLNRIIEQGGNFDDISSFLIERNLPLDEIELEKLSHEILQTPPLQGYLTISNALQWRLQYSRAIELSGKTAGIFRVGLGNGKSKK